MKEKSRNLVASVRQRLLNLSQERGEDPNLIFIRYALERFLYRLSRSRQSGKFILKGARPMGLRQAAGYGSFFLRCLPVYSFSKVPHFSLEPFHLFDIIGYDN
jgi:hypothetical protein